ncbi:MAG: MarR family transcriptional regulator, partial [Tenericutes bacterium]|nr:MarR family transcriptional regulator [Mycoplasmatota bacterium]
LSLYGLTSSQVEILFFIRHNKEKVNQSDIERHFKLSNPTVTGIINRLENNGFVKRVKDDKDARVKNIILTEKSNKVKEQMHEGIKSLEKQLFKDFTEEEKEELCLLLGKLFKNIS